MPTYLGLSKNRKPFQTTSYKVFKRKSGNVLSKPPLPPERPPEPTPTPVPTSYPISPPVGDVTDVERAFQGMGPTTGGSSRVVDGINLGPLTQGVMNEPEGFPGDILPPATPADLAVPFPTEPGVGTALQEKKFFPNFPEGFSKTARNILRTHGVDPNDSYGAFLASQIEMALMTQAIKDALGGKNVPQVGDVSGVGESSLRGGGQFSLEDLSNLLGGLGKENAFLTGPSGLFGVDIGSSGIASGKDINSFVNQIASLLVPQYGSYGTALASFLGNKIRDYYDRVGVEKGVPSLGGLGGFLRGVL